MTEPTDEEIAAIMAKDAVSALGFRAALRKAENENPQTVTIAYDENGTVIIPPVEL